MRKIKKKKIDRKRLFYTLGFFIFCVFGLTVAYSALSTTLNISGNAEVTSASFGLKIEEASLDYIYGDNTDYVCSLEYANCVDNYLEINTGKVDKKATISSLSIKDYIVSANKPGDQILSVFKIINTGTIPAKYDSVEYNNVEFNSLANNDEDIQWFYNNSVFLSEFIPVENNLIVENGSFSKGDIICPGDYVLLAFAFGIDEETTTLPTAGVSASNVGAEYIFTQADSNVCSN